MDQSDELKSIRQSLQDIHEAIVGNTSKVGLIEWQRTQDVKLTDLAARLTRLEASKEGFVSQVLNKVWILAWAALMGAIGSKMGDR